MPVADSKKIAMAEQASHLARQLTNWNKGINAFMEEWFAEDYASLITQPILDQSAVAGLTTTEFVDGVAALDTVSTAVENNKTNLYKLG